MTATLVWSGTSSLAQWASVWVPLSSVLVKLETPRTATKICAARTGPVSRSTITGTVVAGVIDKQFVATEMT